MVHIEVLSTHFGLDTSDAVIADLQRGALREKRNTCPGMFHLDRVLRSYKIVGFEMSRFGKRLDVRFYTNGIKSR